MHRLCSFRSTVLIVLALALVLEVVNGRFWLNDLRVYVMAADALRHGQAVYGLPFGLDTGYYKYAPGLLYLFIPYTFLPFVVTCVIHFTLISLALVSVIQRTERIMMRHVFGTYAPRPGLRAFIAFLCVAVHLVRELHLGNVNVLLLWCVVAAVEALLEDRDVAGGLLFGAAVLVKPYLLLGLLPLFLLRRWTALQLAGVMLLSGMALPLLIEGPRTGWALDMAWVDAMRAHGGYLTSTNTLRSILSLVCGRKLPVWTDALFIAGATLLVAVMVLTKARSDRNEALVLGVAYALASVPLLVITDVQHFLLALPLIMWSLTVLFRQRSPFLAMLFVVAMLAYGTDSTDLWGRELAERLEKAGAVGWGTVLLLITALALAFRPMNPVPAVRS